MKRQPTSLGCFLCGKDNPHGLHVFWTQDDKAKTVLCETEISENYRSYPGVVHGGVVAALLDETAGRAIIMDNGPDALMVTLKLEVVYKKVTPTNTKLKIYGRVKKTGTSRAVVEGEIVLPDGSVSAAATALIVKPPAGLLAGWTEEEAEWRRTSAKE